MGFFGGLNTEKYDRQYSDLALLRRIAAYYKPRVKLVLIAAVAIFLQSLFDAGVPIVNPWR